MPAHEVPAELPFPSGGINLLTEFQEQPPGTTPVGENVRCYDTYEQRARGGSRPGLKKYIPEQLPSGTNIIQHLNVIVDPQAAGFRQEFVVPDPDWIEDPLHPGTFVPPGGWGNPGGAPEESVAGDITFIQKKGQNGFGVTSSEQSMVFDAPVYSADNDRLVVIWVGTAHNTNLGVEVTVESDAGGFSRVGQSEGNNGYVRITDAGFEYSLSVWYRLVENNSSEDTIRVTPSAAAFLKFFGANWSGMNLAPFVDSNSNTGSGSSVSTGDVNIAGADRLLCAGFIMAGSNRVNYEAEADVEGLFQFDIGGASTDTLTGAPTMSAAYWIGPNAVIDALEGTLVGGAVEWGAQGVCFKD
jgi:hypothetical protein